MKLQKMSRSSCIDRSRTRKRALLLEQLEDRIVPDNGLWLGVFGGVPPAADLVQQAQYGQQLLDSAGVPMQDAQVVEALDLSGSFVVQAPLDASQEAMTTLLQRVPGFIFTTDFTRDLTPPSTDIPGPTTRSGYEALYGPFNYEAFVGRERIGSVPDGRGPSGPSPAPADSLTNNNTGSIGTGNFTQSETSLVAFGNTVVVGFNDSGANAGGANKFTGYAYSTDGGATFTDGGTLPTNPGGDAGDPVLARNDTTGRIYFSTLGFTDGLIKMFRSDDNGVTWMAPVQATPGGADEDKQWHVVDNYPGVGNGNVYLLSRRFGGTPGIYAFRSTDHGATFGPTGGTLIVSGQQGAYVAVGPDHAVYAFYYNTTNVQVRKSTDFGVTFGAPVTVATFLAVGGTNGDLGLTGIRQGDVSPSGFRSSKFPHAAINPVNGHLYAVYADDGPGVDRGDIYVVQSTNGGVSWGAPIKVNDDVTTTDQWQPTLAVSPDGSRLGVFYYSRQEDPANNLFKYYGRVATISGSTLTFQPSFAISDTPSLPEFGRDSVVNSVYMGDYDTAVATPGFFHVTWSDNRSDLAGAAPRKDPNVFYEKVPLGLVVTSTLPAVGSVVTTPPTSFTVNVTDPINAGTLQASDLTVNGIAASTVVYTPGTTTIVFGFASTPVTGQGLQTMHVDAGAFTRVSDAGGVFAFDGTFRYDATQLTVTSTSPPVGGVFTLTPPIIYDVNFNEPVDPDSVQAADLVLSGAPGATVSGVTVLPGNTTARFTLGGLTTEVTLTANIAAGAITDTFGNPGAAFSGSYATDLGTVPFPTPLTSKPPLGSLIYDPTASGIISPAGDTDSFTLSVDAGQTITVIVRPTTVTTLQPTVTLRDPSSAVIGTATAPAVNQNAILQTVPTTTTGTYTVTVSGAGGSVGNYTVQVILNAAEERERNAGQPTNNTAGSAQSIDSSFISLGGTASRGAVMGTVSSTADLDFYGMTLTAGDTITVALKGVTSTAVTAQLRDGSGTTILANALSGPANLDKVLSNFVVGSSDTYYVVIGGTVAGAMYDVVVTRNADFDTENNTTLATAQNLGPARAVLGHGGPPLQTKLLAISGAGFTASSLYELNPATGAVIATMGSTGRTHLTDIDVHPITGEIYAVDNSLDQLIKINPTTAAVTVVGSTGGAQVPDISFRSDGTLFGWVQFGAGGSSDLATINLTTGAVTIIPSPISSFQTGIAFDSLDNLYVKTDTLYRVNPATGAIISQVPLSGGSPHNVLEFGPGDVLYTATRSSNTGPSTLQTINVATGVVSTVGTTTGVGITGLAFWSFDESDTYSFSVNVGDALVLSTSTPADGPGEFVNTFNPRIELYDPSGVLVGSGLVLPDGRNESISHLALATGLYRVRIFGESSSKGEYVLGVAGNTGTAQPPFQVTTTNPPNGGAVPNTTTFTVNFNDAYLATSVQPTDLVIDGVLNATAITLVDGDTVDFTLPALASGTHTVAIAAGAIVDVQNTPLSAFASTFTLDTIAPRVTATSIAPNATILPGTLSYQVTFSEPMRISNLSSDDFTLHGNFRQAVGVNYTPSSFSFNAAGTVLTLNYGVLPDDNYVLTLVAGATSGTNFTDAAGNALDGEFSGVFPSGNGTGGGNFVIGLTMDPGTLTFPAPTTTTTPLGGLVYSSSTTAVVAFTGDTDSFTLALDAGQTVTLLVTPSATSPNNLRPTVELRDPSNVLIGSATAPPVLGQRALLQTVPVAVAGTYTFTVSGASGLGLYTLGLTLNAALEAENNNGPSNNTFGTAQSLSPSFLSLGSSASRVAVIGTATTTSPDTLQDWYSFTLAAGDTATVALNTATPNARIFAPDGTTLLATAVTGSTNVSKVITNFTATVGGTYYLQIISTATITYNAVITKNAEFDTEPNNSPAQGRNVQSQQVAGDQYALGHLSSGDLDLYRVTVAPGATLTAQTATPAGGPNPFVNNLNPRLRIYDSIPVASENFEAGVLPASFTTGSFTSAGAPDPNGRIRVKTPDGTGNGSAFALMMDRFPDGSLTLNEAIWTVDLTGVTAATLSFSHIQLNDETNTLPLNFVGRANGDGVAISDNGTNWRTILNAPTNSTWTSFSVDLAAAAAAAGMTLGPNFKIKFQQYDDFSLTTDGRGYDDIVISRSTTLVSDDNSAGDGKNALVSITNSGATAITYFVEVSSTTVSTTIGEYAVRINGNTVTSPPFMVTTTSPFNGALLVTSPTTLVVNFNDPYLASSVSASDLQVDGVNAVSVIQTDGDTLTFTLVGGYGHGTHTVTMSAGSILDVQNTPLSAYAGTFTVDTIAPRVTATSVAPNAVLSPGTLSYQVTFSEPMRISNLSSDDFTLHGNFRQAVGVNYTPSSFSFNAAGTVLTLNYTGLPDDSYTLTLVAGATSGTNFTDAAGNALDGEFTGSFPSGNGTAGGDFVIGFFMDLATEGYPALAPKSPLGSLIYDPSLVRTITYAGDVDEFTLDVDPGQTISIVVTPTAALQPRVELFDPANGSLGFASAGAPGQVTGIQTRPTIGGGTYRIVVNGLAGTTGLYTIQVILNAAFEVEGKVVGATNNTAGTAEDINGSFISLDTPRAHAMRGAVLGTADAAAADYYRFDVAVGERLSLALTNLTGGNVDVQLIGPDGTTVLASGVGGAINLNEAIQGFLVGAAGTYFARVTGGGNVPYSLVVTRDASFDLELNDTFSTAQSISGTGGVLGHMGGSSSNTLTLNWTDSGWWDSNGSHTASNDNYLTGQTGSQYRSFFVFDLSTVTQPISGATLRLYNPIIGVEPGNGYLSTDPTETYGLFDVSTPIATLSGDGSGQTGIFTDLGTGTSFGEQTVSAADNGQIVTIPLNVAGLAALNAALGGQVALGGALTSISGPTDQYIFGYTGLSTHTRQLVLSFGAAEDWYSVDVAAAGTQLRFETRTPADGPGEFGNNLNPLIELYRPDGTLLASGATLTDGGNEYIQVLDAPDVGTYRVRVIAEGGTSGEYFLGTTVGNTPPVTSNNLASQSEQYSDPIDPVTVTAIDVIGETLTASPSFTFNGGPSQAGLPAGLTLTANGLQSSTDGLDTHTWTLSGKANVAPGVYVITVTITDSEGGMGATSCTHVVTQEDARATYTGPLLVSTPAVNNSVAVVPLRATILDITAVSPGSDPDPGVITNATVTFQVYDETGTTLLATVPNVAVTLIDPGETKIGTAAASWTVNISNNDSVTYKVVTIVNNYYTNVTQTNEDNSALVTVAKPLPNFITGGGYLTASNSAGLYAADPGSKTNFGFGVKFNQRGTNLQGRVNIMVRGGGHVYQIKSTALTSLVANPLTGHAELVAKANLTDVTNPTSPISLGGNLTLNLILTDNGEPGTADTLAVTLWHSSGKLYFSSRWNGVQTLEQRLGNGNLQVNSNASFQQASGETLGGGAGGTITPEALAGYFQQAIAFWQGHGADGAILDEVRGMSYYVVDLPGSYLGMAGPGAIWLDRDAAGHGWSQVDAGAVVAHEVGHLLGHEHDDEVAVMQETLPITAVQAGASAVAPVTSVSVADSVFASVSTHAHHAHHDLADGGPFAAAPRFLLGSAQPATIANPILAPRRAFALVDTAIPTLLALAEARRTQVQGGADWPSPPTPAKSFEPAVTTARAQAREASEDTGVWQRLCDDLFVELGATHDRAEIGTADRPESSDEVGPDSMPIFPPR